MEKYYNTNHARWNEIAKIHSGSDSSYGSFNKFRNGGLTLHPIEMEELTEVKEKKLLHLQCHFGLDTLSWARLGAKVTGIDFSPVAINAAKELAKTSEINAQFIESDIYDLTSNFPEPNSFDIVFTSHGVIGWLHDLTRWAQTISYYLKPGGIFYIVELHPFAWLFEDTEDDDIHDFELRYNYFSQGQIPYKFNEEGCYSNPNAKLSNTIEYVWHHSLSEIINNLVKAGLKIEFLNEFPYLTWPLFSTMKQKENNDYYYYLPQKYDDRKIPLMFSLKATKV